MLTIVSAIAMMAGQASPPAVTYLRCAFPAGDILFTTDEANAAVTMNVTKSGFIQRFDASFATDAVRFRDRSGPIDYVISRVDLSIRRTLTGAETSETAQCKVETPPKRAF